jgi:hypothetical protein
MSGSVFGDSLLPTEHGKRVDEEEGRGENEQRLEESSDPYWRRTGSVLHVRAIPLMASSVWEWVVACQGETELL